MAIKTPDWEAKSEQRERNRRIIRQKYFQIQKICVRHSISAWCSDIKVSALCLMFCDRVCLWSTDMQEHPLVSIYPLVYCWRMPNIRRFAISKLQWTNRVSGLPHGVVSLRRVEPRNNDNLVYFATHSMSHNHVISSSSRFSHMGDNSFHIYFSVQMHDRSLITEELAKLYLYLWKGNIASSEFKKDFIT